MGQSNCACVVNKEEELVLRKQQIVSQSLVKSSQNDEDFKILKSIVKIQSALRGWLTRRRYHHLQIRLYDARINKLLLKYSQAHLQKHFNEAQTIESFPFDQYSNPDQNKAMSENRFFQDAQMLENASVYIGEWANEKKNGKGIQVWKDGSIYEGFWVDDHAHGRGRLYHANGDIYDGDWVLHKTKGYGTYYHKDGTKYQGQWDDDKQNGHGVETWPDGTRFEGEYLNGEKHGFGRFAWGDGATFVGNFKRNHIHGIGRYVWPDGRSYCGEWADDKMNGKGVFKWDDGRSYAGGYVDDKKSGQGMFEWPGGKRYVGSWLDGFQHGKGIYFSGQGQNMTRKQGEWRYGQRERWIILDNDTLQIEKLEIQMTKVKNYYSSLTDGDIMKNKALIE